MPNGDKHTVLASLASREASSAAHEEIAGRHMSEKRQARLRIQAKIKEFWNEYKYDRQLAKPDFTGKSGLTSEGGRFVRSKVVELLRTAPLTHGFSASKMFSTTWDIGEKMQNCWHLNLGSGMRERTEAHLFRYDGAKATPQMKTYAHGGKDSPTFSANTRPFYASLNYSRAKFGGSSGWGKTHFVMKQVLIFNATFTYADSFDVESGHKDQGYKLLGNYHNVYPIINNVRAGGKDSDGADYYDVLKSMIDHALGRKAKPDEEFDGKQYVEAQIPGDILFSRDIEIVCVSSSEHPATSAVGKNLAKFAAKHNLRYKCI
jgi:hypothetical protein